MTPKEQDAIEAMIDAHGLVTVLGAISGICGLKAERILTCALENAIKGAKRREHHDAMLAALKEIESGHWMRMRDAINIARAAIAKVEGIGKEKP